MHMKPLFVAAVLLAAGLIPAADEAVSVVKGDPAPEITGTWLEYAQKDAKLSDMQGKYVLMEFWRTW
jgi:hypothetical protein